MKNIRTLLAGSILASLVCADEERWVCTGKLSDRTYSECERLGSLGEGCYYLEHFSQYRSCAEICNDVILYSIDQERCDAYCPDYLRDNCKAQSNPQSTAIATHPLSTMTSTPTNVVKNQEGSTKNTPNVNDSEILLISSCLTMMVALTVVGFYLLVRFRRGGNRDEEKAIEKEQNALIKQKGMTTSQPIWWDNAINDAKAQL